MYPTTDIEYDLLSRKFANKDDFRKMRDFRLSLKAKGDSKNKALKPLINGVYGASKDRNGAMYDPLQANLTCIFGQMFILDIIDKIEPYCRLLQTNTDGIFVLCENEEMAAKVTELVHFHGKRLKMEFEIERYKKLIQKDVNNYIAIFENGKLECKGAMVKFNTPLDNDLAILNEAVRNYYVSGISARETIESCSDYSQFMKVIKLSSAYKEIWHGNGVKEKDKITSIDGSLLREKVHRVFASTDNTDGGIYKLKVEKGINSYEKYAGTPDHLFIDNGNINDKDIPEKLDREWYIAEAEKRIKDFVEKTPEKIDEVPVVLFEIYQKAGNFYDFVKGCYTEKIKGKLLLSYITADCCSKYGKTDKLLKFIEYFDLLFEKKSITLKNLEKKFTNDAVRGLIIKHSELSKSGKSCNDLDYESVLLEIFDLLENKDINPYEIMTEQIKKFNTVRYINDKLQKDLWFVLNTRDIISPNLILYNMRTGDIEYRKVDKMSYRILPLSDGDIIEIKKTEKRNADKIVGKDDKGHNIIMGDPEKSYDVITQFELVYRNYNKSKKSIVNDEFENFINSIV